MKIAINEYPTPEDATWRDNLTTGMEWINSLYTSNDHYDLIIFPELWTIGFFHHERYHTITTTDFADYCATITTTAQKNNVSILAGSFIEPAEGHHYNTAILADPHGTIHTYRKIHLFTQGSAEAELLTPGTTITAQAVHYPCGEIPTGMSICYDLRFPELYRAQLTHECDLSLTIAAWPAARITHWNALAQARAIENQTYQISVNATGTQKGTQLGGNSSIYDPSGQRVPPDAQTETTSIYTIDPSQVAATRSAFTVLKDRKL